MNKKELIWVIVALLLQADISFGNESYDILMNELKDARKESSFIAPSEEALQSAEELFLGLLTGKNDNDWEEEWKNLNFSMESRELNGKSFNILVEHGENRAGKGFYIFSTTTKSDNVLMIPHGLYDYHTSDIGMQLMLEGDFAAISFNTVHRYGNKKLKGSTSHATWDMADLYNTYFTSFTRAFIHAFPKGHLLQLHGFSRKKRKSFEGEDSDIILSTGSEKTTWQMELFSDCLKLKIPGMTRMYPDEVQELGGTKNTIGSIMRSSGHTGFLHIEMSLTMRKKMNQEKEVRTSFLKCVEKL